MYCVAAIFRTTVGTGHSSDTVADDSKTKNYRRCRCYFCYIKRGNGDKAFEMSSMVQALTKSNIMLVLWNVTPCSLVGRY
jgi:hypothetical protein